jgi:hypothetical protein
MREGGTGSRSIGSERFRGYKGVPGDEEVHKSPGSMKAPQGCMGLSAGNDRLCVFRIMR